MRIILIICCLVLIGLSVGCQPASVDSQLPLRGVAVAGPVCPVESVPPDPACDDRPVADALVIIRDAEGREVERVRTGADGTFSVSMVPGRYELVSQPVDGVLGTAASVEVMLRAGGASDPLVLLYDTGIR